MVDIWLKFQQKTNKKIYCWNNQNLIKKSQDLLTVVGQFGL